jgi:hypothetical protein
LNEGISALRILTYEAADYQPLYPEIQNLHLLYLSLLDAINAYHAFLWETEGSPFHWSQSTYNMLSDNVVRTGNDYKYAREALESQF